MNLVFLLWMAIGAATGVSHATALWHTARRWDRAGWGFAWRLPLVVVTLVVAALVGRLLPAALGWAAGLALTSIVFLIGERRWM